MDSAGSTQCQADFDCTFGEMCCLHNRTASLYYCCPTVSSNTILWVVSIFFGLSMLACVLGVLKEKLNIRFGRSSTGRGLCCCHRRRGRRRGNGSPVSRRRHVSTRVRIVGVATAPTDRRAPLAAAPSTVTAVDCSGGGGGLGTPGGGSHPPPYSAVSWNAASGQCARSPLSAAAASSSAVHSPAVIEEPPKYSPHMLAEELPPDYYVVDAPPYVDSGPLHGPEAVVSSSGQASLAFQLPVDHTAVLVL